MGALTQIISFSSSVLERGFWLYVWRIDTPKGGMLYVGRTGDESSPHASPPFVRMSQHLGKRKESNALRRNLVNSGVEPENCGQFELICHGPIFPEVQKTGNETRAELMEKHKPYRDQTAAMEKALADALVVAGYNVLNPVNCRRKYDPEIWAQVKSEFAKEFPRLSA